MWKEIWFERSDVMMLRATWNTVWWSILSHRCLNWTSHEQIHANNNVSIVTLPRTGIKYQKNITTCQQDNLYPITRYATIIRERTNYRIARAKAWPTTWNPQKQYPRYQIYPGEHSEHTRDTTIQGVQQSQSLSWKARCKGTGVTTRITHVFLQHPSKTTRVSRKTTNTNVIFLSFPFISTFNNVSRLPPV